MKTFLKLKQEYGSLNTNGVAKHSNVMDYASVAILDEMLEIMRSKNTVESVDDSELDKLKVELDELSKKVDAQDKELKASKDELSKVKKELSTEKAKVTKLQNANK